MMSSQPPEWATMLINDVKAIKSQVSKIENIEKTMNKMCCQIHDLEVNVIATRLTTVENSCTFVCKQYDDHKKELETTKKELKEMKTTCENLKKKKKKKKKKMQKRFKKTKFHSNPW